MPVTSLLGLSEPYYSTVSVSIGIDPGPGVSLLCAKNVATSSRILSGHCAILASPRGEYSPCALPVSTDGQCWTAMSIPQHRVATTKMDLPSFNVWTITLGYAKSPESVPRQTLPRHPPCDGRLRPVAGNESFLPHSLTKAAFSSGNSFTTK